MTVDASGNPVGWDDYYPYGMQMTGRSYTSSADQRYKFTGKERDASTGLDYFGARYYDSWRGQWGQVDPMVDENSNISGYSYCANNPIALIDLDGNDTLYVNLPKNRKKEGTANLVVNGQAVELTGGNNVKGEGSRRKNPSGDPLKTDGDTPTGEADIIGVNDHDQKGKYVDINGNPIDEKYKTTLPTQIKETGRFFLILRPLSGQFLETIGMRTSIGMHGGGSPLGNHATEPEQRLISTYGCMRFTNRTAAQLAKQFYNANSANREFRVIVNQK